MEYSLTEFIEPLLGETSVLAARQEGWLEAEDVEGRGPEDLVTRQAAARILHTYALKRLGEPDLEDIGGAKVLRDLYDCRVCVNHIAQVYLKGIMDACVYQLEDGRELVVFNHKEILTKAEGIACISRLLNKDLRIKR